MKLLAILTLILLVGCSKLQVSAPERKTEFFKVAWIKNLDPEYQSGNLPIGLSAPRIFNDTVYMGSLRGSMRAYDLETGRVIWAADEKTEVTGAAEYFNDHVAYGGLNGRLFVRHALSGKLKYAIDLGSPIEAAPHFHNGRLFVYLRGHQLVQLDAETGKIIWAYKRAVPITTTLQRVTKPLIIGNKVIVGFADGFVGALSVDEGLLLWETKLAENSKFIDVDLNPVLAGGVVVTGSPSAELKAVNPESGAVARSYGVSVMAHPYLKGEQLILGTNDGEVIIMGLNGTVAKRLKISDQPVSAIAWWKETIVAASFDGKLRAIEPLEMKVIDEFALGYDYSSVFSDIVTYENHMAIYSSRNRLYLFH